MLANVAEHAAASRAVLTVTFHEDAVSLDVLDDGRGFLAADGGEVGMRGHGLAGIHERVAALGGRLDVEATPGAGTAVSVPVAAPVAPAAPVAHEDGTRG